MNKGERFTRIYTRTWLKGKPWWVVPLICKIPLKLRSNRPSSTLSVKDIVPEMKQIVWNNISNCEYPEEDRAQFFYVKYNSSKSGVVLCSNVVLGTTKSISLRRPDSTRDDALVYVYKRKKCRVFTARISENKLQSRRERVSGNHLLGKGAPFVWTLAPGSPTSKTSMFAIFPV